MFFYVPPLLPPSDVSSLAFIQFEIASVESISSCTQGSRDCFPKDRVGVVSSARMMPIAMQSRDVGETRTFKPLGL